MSSVKHSKFKNTGLLFELLVRQITADTLNGVNSPAMKILRKYFVNTELGKEYKLYEQLLTFKNLTEGKAETVINTLIQSSTKLKRNEVRKQRYNLVKEIKNYYDLDNFFRTKVASYKIFAALNNLIETHNSDEIEPEIVINNKLTILEHLTKTPDNHKNDTLLQEYMSYDKDVRILTYRILLDKFNEKYDHLPNNQKQVLREIITSVDNTDYLKNYYNNKIAEVKDVIAHHARTHKDEVLKIKLQEVLKYINPLGKAEKVCNDNILDLLQYYELVNEIK